jgi:hypothetical protein
VRYTDAQLESVLQAECVRGKEFPHTASTGFDEVESCKEFATKLSEARMKELDTGSKVGYEEWCEAYFIEKAGGEAPVAAAAPKVQAAQEFEPAKKGGGSEDKPAEKPDEAPWGLVIGLILLVVIIIGVAYAFMRR